LKQIQILTCIVKFHKFFCYDLFDHICHIYYVTVRLNLPYIIRFEPYRSHNFVHDDASPLLSLTPQNAYDKSAINTLNKANYHSFTRRCGILQSTPLKESDDPIGTTIQPVRSALIPNVTVRPNLPYIVRFGHYRPHGFVPGDASPLLSLTPQNAYDKSATSTLNKANYHSLTRWCGILHIMWVPSLAFISLRWWVDFL